MRCTGAQFGCTAIEGTTTGDQATQRAVVREMHGESRALGLRRYCYGPCCDVTPLWSALMVQPTVQYSTASLGGSPCAVTSFSCRRPVGIYWLLNAVGQRNFNFSRAVKFNDIITKCSRNVKFSHAVTVNTVAKGSRMPCQYADDYLQWQLLVISISFLCHGISHLNSNSKSS